MSTEMVEIRSIDGLSVHSVPRRKGSPTYYTVTAEWDPLAQAHVFDHIVRITEPVGVFSLGQLKNGWALINTLPPIDFPPTTPNILSNYFAQVNPRHR